MLVLPLMQKILLIQTAFIGDVVLATGVLEKLHEFYPEAAIDFLVRKGNESLFANHPFLNKVLIWQKKESKYKHLLQLLKTIRHSEYDRVVNLQRYAATGFLTAFCGAKETIGFDKNPFSLFFSKKIKHSFTSEGGIALHEIERNHLLIEHVTDNLVAKPVLYPDKGDMKAVESYQTKPYICIAPASVWFTKQFPVDKWISFINALPTHLAVYLIGAPTDNILCDSIVKATPEKQVINLAGKLSFLQSAALQKKAIMNYVNDSAPMHFASSVNAPVTAVYCSTVASFGYGPLSEKSFVVEVSTPLICRPCGIHGKKACPHNHFDCANKITNQQLLSVVSS